MTKSITLPHGEMALVDDEDFERLNQYKWHVVHGYAVRKIGAATPTIRMHREIIKTPADMQVDHINRNRLDNRKANLRVVTKSENLKNKEIYKNNKSGFRGVSWNASKRKWVAQINVNEKRKHVGSFASPEEAARAYDKAAKENYGEFAALNFGEAHG